MAVKHKTPPKPPARKRPTNIITSLSASSESLNSNASSRGVPVVIRVPQPRMGSVMSSMRWTSHPLHSTTADDSQANTVTTSSTHTSADDGTTSSQLGLSAGAEANNITPNLLIEHSCTRNIVDLSQENPTSGTKAEMSQQGSKIVASEADPVPAHEGADRVPLSTDVDCTDELVHQNTGSLQIESRPVIVSADTYGVPAGLPGKESAGMTTDSESGAALCKYSNCKRTNSGAVTESAADTASQSNLSMKTGNVLVVD